MLNTSYGVILPAYAAMFLLALVLVNRSTRLIVYSAVCLLFLSPPLMILGMSYLQGAYLLEDIAGGPMSAVALAPANSTSYSVHVPNPYWTWDTPFAAVGRVALTMYDLQFVIVWILTILNIGYDLSGIPLNDLFVVIVTLVIGSIIARMPNGPLESMMRRFDQIFSSFGAVSAPK